MTPAARATKPRLHVTLPIPMRVYSEANRREHWRYKARRAKRQKAVVSWYLLSLREQPHVPATVLCVKLGPSRLDDDNLAGAFKHVRDSVATWLGVDDGSELVTWHYAQEHAKEHSIRIVIDGVYRE